MKRITGLAAVIFITLSVSLMSAFKLPATQDKNHNINIELCYENLSVKFSDNYIKATNHLVKEEIHKRRINASYNEKMTMVETCLSAGASFKNALTYVFPLLENSVKSIAGKINKKPQDSTISFNPNAERMFAIRREKTGFYVDESEVYRNIYYSLIRSRDIRIKVQPKILEPEITAEDNIKLTNLRSRFSTDYSRSESNRKHNIELSLSKINGTVLKPGDEFSFNKVVGQRTEKNGFRTGKIIKGGEYVAGTGGGVCQSSTTIYNCAILSDMEIIKVRNHSLEPSYVMPSFDAMVSSGNDLVFKNSGDGTVFIKAYGNGTKAVVEIYGTKLPYSIVRKSEIISREKAPEDRIELDKEHKYFKKDSGIAAGTQKRIWQSRGQLKSEGYLLYYDHSGRLIERRNIRKDTYNRLSGLIAVAPPDCEHKNENIKLNPEYKDDSAPAQEMFNRAS